MVNTKLRETSNAVEWARLLAERFVLFPAAACLPAPWALRIADGIGAVDAAIPVKTRRVAYQELASATRLPRKQIAPLVRERLAMPRRDLVWRQRFRRGNERLDDWQLTEINAAPVRALLDQGVSFIAAGGHFTTAAGAVRLKVLPLSPMVWGATAHWQPNPFELRRRLDGQADEGIREGLMGMGTRGKNHPSLLIEVPDLWFRYTDWDRAPAFPDIQDRILRHLATPGAVSQILIDAFWEKPNAHRRPFAGISERGFALGAARIARIAQCPIVPFVAVLGPRHRSVILEWGDPIIPGPVDDKSNDTKMLDAAIDFLERGIGRYPTQYRQAIGFDRLWDASEQVWRQRRSTA